MKNKIMVELKTDFNKYVEDITISRETANEVYIAVLEEASENEMLTSILTRPREDSFIDTFSGFDLAVDQDDLDEKIENINYYAKDVVDGKTRWGYNHMNYTEPIKIGRFDAVLVHEYRDDLWHTEIIFKMF